MAKCMEICATQCLVNPIHLRQEFDFLKEDLRLGEQQIEQTWFQRIKDHICDISNIFQAIKSSCLDELDRWDCGHLQDSLNKKLSHLTSETSILLQDILDSKLPTLNKHRYFILFSYGTVNQLETLLRTVGRLSEIDQKIYFEDQCKPLVCEESILIHSLTSIWSNSLSLMQSFKEPAGKLFNDDEQELLIQSLDFSTISLHHHKLFLMDLIATSWLQFNRLLKQEQLITQLPFLCPCHTKQYFKTLESLARQVPPSEIDFVSQLLPLILAPQSKPSLMTQSIRQYGVMPGDTPFGSFSQEDLAYFVVWHLYAVSRVISDNNRPLIKHCQPYLLKCAAISLDQFLPNATKNNHTTPVQNYQVSPHQEERLSLLLLMLNSWYEKNGGKQSCLPVVTLMFSFFDKHWNLFNYHYLDNSEFRISGLTVFQLFTKIIDEIAPLYTVDGHAPANSGILTRDEKQLKAIWDRIVERKEVPEAASSAKKISVSQ